MAESYNPADHTVDEVNAHLDEHPDQAEAVLTAESEAEKPRTGITEGRHATSADDETEDGEGLAGTGNPNDLSTKPDAEVSANIAHQEGAPEELTKVADESAAQGYFGESAAKPDYSQANPEVMNGGGQD
jgi:hypothetical protein